MKLVPILIVAAILIGSCDGSLRKSGWFLGGKERRIVEKPSGEDDRFRATLPDPAIKATTQKKMPETKTTQAPEADAGEPAQCVGASFR